MNPAHANIFRDASLHCEAGTIPLDCVIQRWGNPTEDNDRIATLELRPGMFEGEHQAFALRMWGNGHWCRADGLPSYYTRREDADAAAGRWISEGKR